MGFYNALFYNALFLFAIAADSLGWLLEKEVKDGSLLGIHVSHNAQLLNQQFADDTNLTPRDEVGDVKSALKCLDTFCVASGSLLNHAKTGFFSDNEEVIKMLEDMGCKRIERGTIFRLLGIPMGFNVSLKDRWMWIFSKFKAKLGKWRGLQANLAGRKMVLNHCIYLLLIFYFACSKPPLGIFKMIIRECKAFLWGGDLDKTKLSLVKWDTCIRPKEEGGLGIINMSLAADRLNATWILKALNSPLTMWAQLMLMNVKSIRPKRDKRWKDMPLLAAVCSKEQCTTKGTFLWKSMWGSWERLKPHLMSKGKNKFMNLDSVWFSALHRNALLTDDEVKQAFVLNKKGIKTWADLRIKEEYRWITWLEARNKFGMVNRDKDLFLKRIELWKGELQWCGGEQLVFNHDFCWMGTDKLLPIPMKICLQPSLCRLLNDKWKVGDNWNVWKKRFLGIWRKEIPEKTATHMWLILFQAVWTQERGRKIGKCDGACMVCNKAIEDVYHLFVACFPARRLWKEVQMLLGEPINWKAILLGDSQKVKRAEWEVIRAYALWFIWTARNEKIFNDRTVAPDFQWSLWYSKWKNRSKGVLYDTPFDPLL